MKNIFLLITMIFASLVFTNCSDESYIEGQGLTTDVGNESGNNIGTVTIYTKNYEVATCSGGMSVFVNGEYKGVLTDGSYYDLNCGATGASAITFTVPAGSFTLNASGSGVLCPRYSFSESVGAGQCKVISLN